MINLFKKNNQLYPELTPSERIPRVIKEFVFPSVEMKGFKLLKSGLSIKRNVNIFQQEIWFSKSKWNIDNEICAFTPQFTVTLRNYNNWHKSEYDELPSNDVLYACAANYIEDWGSEFFENDDYDLAKHDNRQLVKTLNENIIKHWLPFLENFSNYKSAVQYLIASERYFLAPKMIDISMMNGDLQTAKEIIIWFRSYERTGKSEFMESTLEDIKKRETKINGA